MTLQCNVLCAHSGTILCGASAGVLRNLRFEQLNIVAEGGGTKCPTLFHVFPRQVDPPQLRHPTLAAELSAAELAKGSPATLDALSSDGDFSGALEPPTDTGGGGALGERKRAAATTRKAATRNLEKAGE